MALLFGRIARGSWTFRLKWRRPDPASDLLLYLTLPQHHCKLAFLSLVVGAYGKH